MACDFPHQDVTVGHREEQPGRWGKPAELHHVIMAGDVPHGPGLTVHKPQHTLCGQTAQGTPYPCLCSSRARGPPTCPGVGASGRRFAKALRPPHPGPTTAGTRAAELMGGLISTQISHHMGISRPQARPPSPSVEALALGAAISTPHPSSPDPTTPLGPVFSAHFRDEELGALM